MTNKVRLTRETIGVLTNFVDINKSIIFRKGNVIKTISNAENILAEYTCEEEFPIDFAIYDLAQFLGTLRLFDSPTLEFDSPDYLTVRDSGKSVRYYFSDPEITLKSAPDKSVTFPESDIEFTIHNNALLDLQKASKDILNLPDLTFSCQDEEIRLVLRDKDNDTSNNFKQKVEGTSNGDLELDVKMENVRLLDFRKVLVESSEPQESFVYSTRVSKALISEWSNERLGLKYYIALEP
tara:strand:- start:1150 stop:1863 length:714 start_codon:yes stop_codon:yes gene_type:complete